MRMSWATRCGAAVAVAALLCGPARAEAEQLELTCARAADLLASATPSMQFNVIGQTVGATSFLANILCFVGDERCDCLRDATDSESAKNAQWSDAIGALVADCSDSDPDRSLSGISQEAVLSICP